MVLVKCRKLTSLLFSALPFLHSQPIIEKVRGGRYQERIRKKERNYIWINHQSNKPQWKIKYLASQRELILFNGIIQNLIQTFHTTRAIYSNFQSSFTDKESGPISIMPWKLRRFHIWFSEISHNLENISTISGQK